MNDGLASGARFPAELIPHDAARRLLERLGVEIVTGDAELIARARRHNREQWEAEAAARRHLRAELERHRRSVRAADERTAHMPYRRRGG